MYPFKSYINLRNFGKEWIWHYLEELVDFARWLRGQVQTANSGDFDRWLSKVNLGIETDLEKGMLFDDQADKRRLDFVSIDAKKSITGARFNAEDRRRAAEKLRELMPYPFLPKVP